MIFSTNFQAQHIEKFRDLYGEACPDVVVPQVIWSRTKVKAPLRDLAVKNALENSWVTKKIQEVLASECEMSIF